MEREQINLVSTLSSASVHSNQRRDQLALDDDISGKGGLNSYHSFSAADRMKSILAFSRSSEEAVQSDYKMGCPSVYPRDCLRAGLVTKKPLSQEDVNIVVDLFRSLKPAQIYAAGDLSDPHGTHRTCLQVAN